MSRLKQFKKRLSKGLLWRLTSINIIVIAITLLFSGWAIYQTACFLVDGMGTVEVTRKEQFNATLLNYLWIFIILGILVGSVLHFYVTRRLIHPIRQLTKATKQMKTGNYPSPIQTKANDEVGALVHHFNGLIDQVKQNETLQKKMLTDVSHELRTPLTHLSGYLHALKNGVIEGNEALYENLHQTSKRLTSLVQQLEQTNAWDQTTTQTMTTKQRVDIHALIEPCLAMFDWQRSEANILLDVRVESCKLLMDTEGIQQVLNNLLDNAITYYEGYGPITVHGKSDGSTYRLSIEGPSQAIPEHAIKQLFERFYRVDLSRSRIQGGSGLGLAIAKEIIDHHQGAIGVHAKKDRNEFWFTLPI